MNEKEIINNIHKTIGRELVMAGRSFNPALLKEIIELVVDEYKRLTGNKQ